MKKHKPRLSFSIVRTQVLAILMSIGIGYFFIVNQISDFIVKEAVKNNYNTAIAIEAFLIEELDEPLNVLYFIEETLLSNDLSSTQIDSGLNNLNKVYQYFDDIEIIDFDGKVINTINTHIEEIGFDRSNEISIKYLSESNLDYYWSDINLSPYSNARTVSIALKSKVGYIIGYLNLDYIQETTFEYISKLNKDFEIVITDKYGTYLVYKNSTFVNERRIYPKIKNSKMFIEDASKYKYSEDDEQILLSSIQMENISWIVTVEQSYNKAIALMDYFTYYFILFIIILLLIFILISMFGLNRIIKNISSFSAKLTNFHQAKDQNNHINYFKEFDQLESSFNNMIETLAEKDLKLQKLAFYDSLTGMLNRTFLIDNIIPKFDENTNPYTVIFIDLDNFSYINDIYGHQFGDKLLVEFSKIIKKTFKDDILIRLGGDEFIVIVNHNYQIQQYIEESLRVVRGLLENPLAFSDNSILITFSDGYSQYPTDGNNFYDILKNADSAMYHSKSNGKNSSSYFRQSMKFEVERKLHIDQQLHKALERNEFTLLFQPQINVDCTEIRGFEALIRWNNEFIGQVNTPDFIKIAEENRFIIEIGNWVIEEACKFIKKINYDFSEEFIICINASPVELRINSYVERVSYFINLYKIKPNWLEIEITENISIEEFNLILPQLLELKMLGISLAIDDFGTGYSSLSYLQNLPLDILKIDRMFINQVENDARNNLMIQTIIFLAKSLDLKIVAEGVETQFQLDILKNFGCDYIQGYLVSRPISSAEIIDFINDNKKKMMIMSSNDI